MQNNHTQAFVSSVFWNQFGGIINPGGLYIIRNMHVSAATRLLRLVRSANCIYFISSTTVHQDHHNDSSYLCINLKLYICECYTNVAWFMLWIKSLLISQALFCKFRKIIGYVLKNFLISSYIDILEVLKNLEEMWTMETRSGPIQVIRFKVSDGV